MKDQPAPGKPATWSLMLDPSSKGSQPFVTTDLASGQFKSAGDFKFPFRSRHGAVLAITAPGNKTPQERLRQSPKQDPWLR